MAKNKPARKPTATGNAAAPAGNFAPLPLTPAEKGITRAASTALMATVADINGVSLTLTTETAKMAYFNSLQTWLTRRIAGAFPKAKARTAGSS